VALQFGELVEGVGAGQFAGMDQAHEKIAHLGALECAVKQGYYSGKRAACVNSKLDPAVREKVDAFSRQACTRALAK
jgi:hypothetical protein